MEYTFTVKIETDEPTTPEAIELALEKAIDAGLENCWYHVQFMYGD